MHCSISRAEGLSTLGIDAGERRVLAGLYLPGPRLWRARVDHFTPWDLAPTVSSSCANGSCHADQDTTWLQQAFEDHYR